MIKRRKFLQQSAWLGGGFFLLSKTPLLAMHRSRNKVFGRVLSNGKAVKGVTISDGYTVIQTDAKGKFFIEPHADAVHIFISTPAGYAFLQDKNIAAHYRQISETNAKKEIVFNLQPLQQNDDKHQFLILADPQVKHAEDVKKFRENSIPDVKQTVALAGANALMHGITVGDLVWDDLSFFKEYAAAVEQTDIPFFQCLGNHDMDYNKGGDETSDDTFQQTFGPTYYSFNRGKAHYIVMDNVRYLGKDREYDGFFQQHQLEWLVKDLAFTPKDALIICCVHIPVATHTKNKDALYHILGDRNVHIMSGHTHYHRNIIRGNIYEHNHGTVCGAWWTGPICEDGTPNGYGMYLVEGTELKWQYKPTGLPVAKQMRNYVSRQADGTVLLQTNIWNFDDGWSTTYAVDEMQMGPLKQINAMDPLAVQNLQGADKPKPRSFAEPKMTDHIFTALLPATAKKVVVTATDRFGNVYTETENIVA